jgi:Zn-dependent protease with chaperone function
METLVTAPALLALAAVLLWPVPALLARSRGALRHPAPALIAWQVIGLASGLALIGAGVAYGLNGPLWMIGVAGVFAAYLLGVAVRVTVRTLRWRRRHRAVLDLVGTPWPALPGGRLLDSNTAMAYCLPGRRPRLVVTSAALRGLSPQALEAVVAHESAHLLQRHDLVVLPFVAWQTALPFLPGARTARVAVALLVEALADDAARSRVGAEPLGEALRAVGLSGSADYPAPPNVELRLARL